MSMIEKSKEEKAIEYYNKRSSKIAGWLRLLAFIFIIANSVIMYMFMGEWAVLYIPVMIVKIIYIILNLIAMWVFIKIYYKHINSSERFIVFQTISLTLFLLIPALTLLSGVFDVSFLDRNFKILENLLLFYGAVLLLGMFFLELYIKKIGPNIKIFIFVWIALMIFIFNYKIHSDWEIIIDENKQMIPPPVPGII